MSSEIRVFIEKKILTKTVCPVDKYITLICKHYYTTVDALHFSTQKMHI